MNSLFNDIILEASILGEMKRVGKVGNYGREGVAEVAFRGKKGFF